MLSKNAQKLINDYLNLPFADVSKVRCPYLNNARLNRRGQLRVLIGKGMPKEIVEEAKITSIQYGHEIFDKHGLCHLATDQKPTALRHYLIDNNLGVDCSAFVTHVLDQHFLETKHIKVNNNLHVTSPKKILRFLISKLRPLENINVKTYTNNTNTEIIKELADAKSGDIITMIQTGPNKKRDHILIITNVDEEKIKYAHARAWSSEGKYGHGVSVGEIKITTNNAELLEQEWVELEKTNEQNETYLEAKNATKLEIRRIKL